MGFAGNKLKYRFINIFSVIFTFNCFKNVAEYIYSHWF